MLTSRLTRLCLSAVAAAVLLCASLQTACAQACFHVLDHWAIGGQGGWDMMEADGANRKLYLAHNATVEVVGLGTGKKIGAITDLQGAHGVALDPEDKYGYISDGKGNAIVVFDRHSYAKLATVPAGTNPDSIAYEPVTKTVWAFNGRSSDVSVLDTKTRQIVATIKLPGKPEFAVADGQGFLFDNIEDKNEIVKLDAHTLELVATYPLEGCNSPSGLAIDKPGRRLFSVCDGKVMALTSADTGKVIATVPIGEGPDGAGYDALHKLAIASNGRSGDMTILDVSGPQPKVVATVATAPGARTMAVDETTGRVYTATAKFGPKPEPSATNPRGRAAPLPDTFEVIVVGR